ncbi:MAG: OB-fold nucleic acid binding domain-containing protein [Chloroflexi bacterium]|nr:OB-fold nucleic acid binding domain-containing protein [Chloroflexota bacterium]
MAESYHPDKGPSLSDLQAGQRFVGFYLVRKKALEPFRDASRGVYLTLILADAAGQIIGRVWEDAQSAAEQIQEGMVVKVEGEVDKYMDRLQVRVLRVRPARENEYDRRDFLPAGSRDPAEMLAELDDLRQQISNPHLRRLVDTFFGDPEFRARFSQAPASTQVHHAYLGGLLEHTLQVLHLSKTVIALYPKIDPNLLLAGAFLYEIGKVREFKWEMELEYSNEGRLLGHIVLADEMVSEAIRKIPDFPAELALRLRHMLVAHHGRYEWGSPRRPQTLEAIALHHIEDLDTQVNRFEAILEHSEPDAPWTPYDRLLGRQLYTGEDTGEEGAAEE